MQPNRALILKKEEEEHGTAAGLLCRRRRERFNPIAGLSLDPGLASYGS